MQNKIKELEGLRDHAAMQFGKHKKLLIDALNSKEMPMTELPARELNTAAFFEAAHNYLEGLVIELSGHADGTGAELIAAFHKHSASIISGEVNDTWGGRENDVARAAHDGLRDAYRNALIALR